MLEHAGSGHSAGPFGLADIFTALYFVVLNYDPKNPDCRSAIFCFLVMATVCQYAMPQWLKRVILIKMN